MHEQPGYPTGGLLPPIPLVPPGDGMWPFGRETGATIDQPSARRSLMPEQPAVLPSAVLPSAAPASTHPPRPPPEAAAPAQSSVPQFQVDSSKAWVHLSNPDNKVEFTAGDIAATLRTIAGMLKVSGTGVEIVSHVIPIGRAGPYKAICSVEAAKAFLEEKTIAFVQNGVDEEVEMAVELLDENGYTKASNARYASMTAGRTSKRADADRHTVRVFIDLPDQYLRYIPEHKKQAKAYAQTIVTRRLNALDPMHDVEVSYISAEAADSTMETRTLVGFVRFDKSTSLNRLTWADVKYLDDGFSKDMIKLRLPSSGLGLLELKQCCFSPVGQCEARRDGKPCPWRTMAYKERASNRARAGGRPTSAEHQERRDAKQTYRDERKRGREAGEQAAAAAASDRVCGRWMRGQCSRGTLKTGGQSPTGGCHRRHAFNFDGNTLEDSAAIDCDLGYECYGVDECPYRHPVPAPEHEEMEAAGATADATADAGNDDDATVL